MNPTTISWDFKDFYHLFLDYLRDKRAQILWGYSNRFNTGLNSVYAAVFFLRWQWMTSLSVGKPEIWLCTVAHWSSEAQLDTRYHALWIQKGHQSWNSDSSFFLFSMFWKASLMTSTEGGNPPGWHPKTFIFSLKDEKMAYKICLMFGCCHVPTQGKERCASLSSLLLFGCCLLWWKGKSSLNREMLVVCSLSFVGGGQDKIRDNWKTR